MAAFQAQMVAEMAQSRTANHAAMQQYMHDVNLAHRTHELLRSEVRDAQSQREADQSALRQVGGELIAARSLVEEAARTASASAEAAAERRHAESVADLES